MSEKVKLTYCKDNTRKEQHNMKLMRKLKVVLALAIIAAVLLPLAVFGLTSGDGGPVYTSFTGRVTMINDNAPYMSSIRVEEEEGNGVYDFFVTENTFFMSVDEILPIADIEEGDELRVYFIQPLISTMIFPPTREASVFVKVPAEDEARSVFVGRFDENLVSDDNFLRLNISEDTVILRQNGEPASDIPLANRDLAVVYAIATRSIPALTTPELIVILNPTPEMSEQMMAEYFANEAAAPNGYVDFEVGGPALLSPEDIAALSAVLEESLRGAPVMVLGEAIDAPAPIVRNNLVFLPLRAIAEALGFDVTWEAETASVALGVGIRVQIGSYEYLVGRAAPITLGHAPFIADNNTYVPMEFFSMVLNFEAGYMIEDMRGEIFILERPE